MRASRLHHNDRQLTSYPPPPYPGRPTPQFHLRAQGQVTPAAVSSSSYPHAPRPSHVYYNQIPAMVAYPAPVRHPVPPVHASGAYQHPPVTVQAQRRGYHIERSTTVVTTQRKKRHASNCCKDCCIQCKKDFCDCCIKCDCCKGVCHDCVPDCGDCCKCTANSIGWVLICLFCFPFLIPLFLCYGLCKGDCIGDCIGEGIAWIIIGILCPLLIPLLICLCLLKS